MHPPHALKQTPASAAEVADSTQSIASKLAWRLSLRLPNITGVNYRLQLQGAHSCSSRQRRSRRPRRRRRRSPWRSSSRRRCSRLRCHCREVLTSPLPLHFTQAPVVMHAVVPYVVSCVLRSAADQVNRGDRPLLLQGLVTWTLALLASSVGRHPDQFELLHQ